MPLRQGPGAFPQVKCPLLVILANNATSPGPRDHSPNTIQAFSPIQINRGPPSFTLRVLGGHRKRQAHEREFAGVDWSEHG